MGIAIKLTCIESDELRKGLNPWSSLTNYIKGMPEETDPRAPAHTYTEWCDDDRVVRLIDVLDKDGCRHTKVEIDMKEED